MADRRGSAGRFSVSAIGSLYPGGKLADTACARRAWGGARGGVHTTPGQARRGACLRSQARTSLARGWRGVACSWQAPGSGAACLAARQERRRNGRLQGRQLPQKIPDSLRQASGPAGGGRSWPAAGPGHATLDLYAFPAAWRPGMIGLLPAPTFGHAAEAFVVAHEAPGAWAKGTAVKYRQTLAALEARLAGDAPGIRSRRRGARHPGRRQRAGGRVRDARPGDPSPAPVGAAIGHRLVGGGRLGDRRPDRGLGQAEGPGQHHPGADPRAGHRDLEAGRAAAG